MWGVARWPCALVEGGGRRDESWGAAGENGGQWEEEGGEGGVEGEAAGEEGVECGVVGKREEGRSLGEFPESALQVERPHGPAWEVGSAADTRGPPRVSEPKPGQLREAGVEAEGKHPAMIAGLTSPGRVGKFGAAGERELLQR